jgi:hypothetical protein
VISAWKYSRALSTAALSGGDCVNLAGETIRCLANPGRFIPIVCQLLALWGECIRFGQYCVACPYRDHAEDCAAI